MAELGAQRALNDGFLEATSRGLDLARRQRAFSNELVQHLDRNRGQYLSVSRLTLPSARHKDSSSYASHTEFLTGSFIPRTWRTGVPAYPTHPTAPETLHSHHLSWQGPLN